MGTVLYTFVGNHDPVAPPAAGDDPGPVLSLLQYRSFDVVVLLATGPDYAERAWAVQQSALRLNPGVRCMVVDVVLRSVVDYEEIRAGVRDVLTRARATLPYGTHDASVLLDPGTPMMQTVWFTMVQSGELDATLLQGIPPRFGGGTYRVREVRVERISGRSAPPTEASPLPPMDESSRILYQTEALPTAPRNRWTTETRPLRRDDRRHPGAPPVPPTPPPARPPRTWSTDLPELVGRSQVMEILKGRISRVGELDRPVLITGEPGTGKELVARAIHLASPRADRAFLAVNAAAIAGAMVESELFGHVKGAYTGAAHARAGKFAAADGGTLFLDEIGDLPLEIQAKLLRVIEYGEMSPLGSDRTVRVDVRVVSATNRNLAEMAAAGTFRDDLLQRLRVLPVEVPPLREREGDLVMLARTFVQQWSDRYGEPRTLTDGGIAALRGWHWPGNVRELENVITQACAFGSSHDINGATIEEFIARGPVGSGVGIEGGIDDGIELAEREDDETSAEEPSRAAAGGTMRPTTSEFVPSDPAAALRLGPVDLPAILTTVERRWYAAALARTKGKRADAARLLGVAPATFRKALRERFGDIRR